MYPRDAQVHGFLAGMIYPTFANYEKAVKEATTAIEIDPDLAIAMKSWPTITNIWPAR